MVFDTDAWTVARNRYLETLDPTERLLFHEATIENLYYSTSVINSADSKSSKVRRAIEAVQPLVDKIESYGKAMDAYANISPTFLSPIWGSIRVVLILAKGMGKFFEKVTECLGRIGDILPRLLDYQRIFSQTKYPRLTESLAKTYLDIIEVCIDFREMIQAQQKNPLKRVVHSSSMEQKFKDAEARFRAHRKTVEKEAETSHMIEAAEARAIVLRDRKLQEMNNKAEARKRLLELLSIINGQQKHEKVRNVRHKDTGNWLFARPEYRSWTNMKTSSALCCYGIPGCGKTVLASSVIDTLVATAKMNPLAVAYHYCDYADKRTLEPIVILGSLARTLYENIDIPTEINELITETYRDGERVPEAKEVLEILSRTIDLFKNIVLVVDGIDEVKEENRQPIYDALKTLIQNHKVPVRLFMSCREDILSSVSTIRTSNFRLQISERTISMDIEGHIHHSVASLILTGDLVIRKPELEGAIVEALIEGAKGMFLWVKFQLNELCTAESDDAIKKTLRDLPKDLSETYDRLLGRIVGLERQELVKRMFRWIICARRPLFVDELCEGIAFTINDTRWNEEKIPTDILRLVRACGNLVVIDEETRTIKFAHYTVQQYILDVQTSKEKFFHFNLQEAQELLGEVCVAYLNFSDFETQVTVYQDNNVTAGMAAIERVVAATDLPMRSKGHLDAMSLFTRMVHNKVKSTNIEYSRHIPKKTESVQHLLSDYRLLSYVRENWLWHTSTFRAIDQAKTRRDLLFHDLVLKKQLPFSFRPWRANANTKMKHPYLEPVGWTITTNHCPLVNTLFKIDPTFDPSKYFEDAGEWFFEDKINTYISADMLERLEYCSQDIWDSKSIPGQGWLYSRMLNACRRGNLDVLRLCVPEVFKLSSVVSPSYPWYQISGHLMLEAAANNQLEIVEHFSQQYGAMDLREEFRSFTSIHDGNVYNALERAALSGHLEIAVLLRKQGWKPLSLLNYGAKDGITRLDQAARQGNFHIVAALLEVLKLDWIDIGYDHLEMGKLNAFISAASEGHEFVVRACRKYGLNPLRADQGGMCAFMRAIRNGRYKVVEYLLTPDPDVRAEACGVRANVEGLPLSLAASMGHMDIAELLLKNGADAFSTSSNAVDLIYSDLVPIIDMSPTPLYAASANGHKAMVEFLLVHGAGPDSLSPTGVLSQSTDPRYRKNGLTRRRIFYSDKRAYEIRDITAKIDVAHWQRPLAGAAVNGQLEVVKTLLQTDIDINAKDSNQDTALFLAAALGHKEIMRELLDAGATTTDFTVHTTAVRQLLMCATDPDRVEGLRCLLELGTHPDNLSAEGQTALFNAVTTGSPLAASILLEAGAEIDFRDFKHNTALSAACNHSNVVAASLLIDAKADVNAENAQGQSILLQACRKATMEIVQLLVARGAWTNSTDVRNYTPLFAACERGHAGIVKVLLANHAEVNYKLPYRGSNETSDGAEILAWPKWTTPLMVAAMKGWKNIIEMLVAKGTDLEAVDATERTAVMSAAILGRTREVGVLIRHGASIKRRNKHGRGLLSMAVEAKSFELVSYLLSLHYSALEQTPPRLLFSSRDSGQALEYANANFELGVFQRGVDEILKHYGHAREYQKKHQSRYKGVEMEDLRKKWSKITPVAPEDEAPYDLVRQIQATAEALQEFKTAHKEGAQDLIDATINGTNSLEETYAAGIGARR